jgi:intracellular septation protein A
VSVGALLLGTGPRFARDALGPVLVFYLGWKLIGLTAGIAGATVVALIAYRWERRRARSGLNATIGLGIALVQAVAGLASGSALAYFGPPIIINLVYGLAFVVSVIVGRPLAGVFAQDTYPFPPEVKASPTFRRVFSRISLVWGGYLLLRSGFRLYALSWRNVELFIAVNVVTGIPFTAALMAWSIWYGLRRFRRSPEWGWALER